MLRFAGLCFGMLVRFFRGSRSLLLENLALRQQLVTLKRRNPRPSLGLFDKLFWVIARRVWAAWKQSLLILTPETFVHLPRTRFCLYWRLIFKVRRHVGCSLLTPPRECPASMGHCPCSTLHFLSMSA